MYKIDLTRIDIIEHLQKDLSLCKVVYPKGEQGYDIVNFKILDIGTIGNLIEEGSWTEKEYLKDNEDNTYMYIKHNIEVQYREDQKIEKLIVVSRTFITEKNKIETTDYEPHMTQ
jgi:hypothetical protein